MDKTVKANVARNTRGTMKALVLAVLTVALAFFSLAYFEASKEVQALRIENDWLLNRVTVEERERIKFERLAQKLEARKGWRQ